MSWLFSQALVAEYSEANSLAGEPSAPLNVMPTPLPFWHRDKTMDVLSLSPFGLTWKPLTVKRGGELLTWFRAGFRARIYPPPGKGPESAASAADSGGSLPASLARFDRATSSWKTHQSSLLGGWEPFSETWPRWGMMRAGECWAQSTLAHLTNGTGYGFGANWPTPDARDAQPEGLEAGRRRMAKYSTCGLQTAVKLWQTPVADDAVERKAGKWNSRGEPKLSAQVKLWPTPLASMSKGSSPNSLVRKSGASRQNDRLDHAVMARDGGQLNPNWVEWLMGWPIAWTDLKPLATDKCHCAQQWHGKSFHGWIDSFSRVEAGRSNQHTEPWSDSHGIPSPPTNELQSPGAVAK